MSATFYRCGCGVTRSTLSGQITSATQCAAHWYLRDENKTLRQMAQEIVYLAEPVIDVAEPFEPTMMGLLAQIL